MPKGLVLDMASQVGGVMPDVTTIRDASRFKNHGTGTNITWTQLPSGRWVMGFNGATSKVNCGTNMSVRGSVFTVATWIKPVPASGEALLSWSNTLNVYPSLCISQGAVKLPLIYLGALNFRYFNTSSVNIYDGNYHFTVFVVTGSAQADINNSLFYADGVAQTVQVTNAGGAQAAKDNLIIGFGTTAGYRLNAPVAKLRMYNYILTPAQIREKYESERRWFGV